MDDKIYSVRLNDEANTSLKICALGFRISDNGDLIFYKYPTDIPVHAFAAGMWKYIFKA